MAPISSGLSFSLPSASSLTDKAAKFITNISSPFDTRNAIVRRVINGHQFEATLVSEPTKCSQCNQVIWFPHGQRCKLCKLSSHMKCLNSIDSRCVQEAASQQHNSQLHPGTQLKEHQFQTSRFITPAATMCDHCGTYIILLKSYDECAACYRTIHHECLGLVSRECRTRDRQMITTSRKTDQSLSQRKSSQYEHTSRLSIDQFEILKLLGTGSFSKVYLAKLIHKTSPTNMTNRSDKKYAIKVIKKTNPVINGNPESVFTEWRALNLGRNYDFLTIAHCCFQSRERLYFVMEYVEGRDLLYYVNEEGKFSESRARFHSAEIVLALIFLHRQRLVYRDLKLNNVILEPSGHCKLLDFGMSKMLSEERGLKTNTFCGTVFYISPEILRGEPYDYSVDWWSLGVLMYEMLCDALPFNGQSDDEIFAAIETSQLKYPPGVNLSDRARSILSGLLTKDPQHRLGCQLIEGCSLAVKEHPFFMFETSDLNKKEAHLWDEIEAKRIAPPYMPKSQCRVKTNLAVGSRVQLSPVNSQQLNEISQSAFENFSQYSGSFDDPNSF